MSVGFYTHPDCSRHDMGAFHPECPARLAAIDDALIASGLAPLLERREAPRATREQLLRGHSAEHVERLHQLAALERDYIALDPDTILARHSHEAALRAAGACIAAVDAVLAGELASAFCAVRPPGHHAMRNQAMGFCFYGNVALAARHALEVHGLERVAVIDFDVHHGNGTEDLLRDDPRVLMACFFQHPFYPYSGADHVPANAVHVPLPAYTRGAAMRAAVEREWLPRLAAFAPQLLLVSAGFDAHRDDELGQMGLVEADYAWLTELLLRQAQASAGGRIVSSLEGGYNLDALGRSVVAHLKVLVEQ